MPLNNEDIEVFDNLLKSGKSIKYILQAVEWLDREKERLRVKGRKHHKDHYVPTGKPRGRPKKEIEK